MRNHDGVLDQSRSFVILAPRGVSIPGQFGAVCEDKGEHLKLMKEMQKLRGRIYVQDGAITPSDLDPEARHRMPGDDESWHLLRVRGNGSIAGCARILVHPRSVSYFQMRLAGSALARCATWGSALRAKMESEILLAARTGRCLTEPGGWALAEDLRGSTEALSIAVGALAWGQIFGGGVGFMTATVRHGSSSILRRLGGVPVELNGTPAPAYFDPAYGCHMELLRFDSEGLNTRFVGALSKTKNILLSAQVVSAGVERYKTAAMAA